MASIKKDDKTGTYYFVLDLPRDPVTGRRRQAKRRGFKNKKEAQAAANALYHELTHGTYVSEADISFGKYCDEWLEYYSQIGKVKPSSIRSREKAIRSWKSYFNAIPLSKITRKMYEDALIDMKKNQKYSDNTIVTRHSCAKMIFKRAQGHGLIKVNPTDNAEIPKTIKTVQELEEQSEVPKYLEKDELLTFLKTAQEQGLYGDYETFLTLAYTGMRIGELIPLRDTDIDFNENTISITKTYFNELNNVDEYKLLTPKTKTSVRVIEVDPIVIAAIENYINKTKPYIMLHRNRYYDKGYIFPNKERFPGYPNLYLHYQSRMKRLLKLAGLNTTLSLHSLRHTHTSLLAAAGVPLEEIMDRLGHANDTITKTVYLHVTKSRKKEASIKFGEIMNS